MFRVCYMVYLQQNKPPKSIHVSGDWNWTLLLLVTPEVCSEGWSWTGPRRVGSWLPRSVPVMTSQNWDLASLTWRIWASAGEGCFSGNVLLSWKNPVKMVPVAAKKNAENCEKSWTKCFWIKIQMCPTASIGTTSISAATSNFDWVGPFSQDYMKLLERHVTVQMGWLINCQ